MTHIGTFSGSAFLRRPAPEPTHSLPQVLMSAIALGAFVVGGLLFIVAVS